MQTETSSTVSRNVFHILIGYNLPFFLWTAYAVQRTFWSSPALWQCPVQKVFGWCPGCGLTTSYVQFMKTGTFQNAFFILVLSAFLLNTLLSFRKAFLLLIKKSS